MQIPIECFQSKTTNTPDFFGVEFFNGHILRPRLLFNVPIEKLVQRKA